MLGLLFVAAGAGLWPSDCSRTSTGMMPLTAPFRAYKGMPGGLSANNSNTRPAALAAFTQTFNPSAACQGDHASVP
jgi:hypothetical protein